MQIRTIKIIYSTHIDAALNTNEKWVLGTNFVQFIVQDFMNEGALIYYIIIFENNMYFYCT